MLKLCYDVLLRNLAQKKLKKLRPARRTPKASLYFKKRVYLITSKHVEARMCSPLHIRAPTAVTNLAIGNQVENLFSNGGHCRESYRCKWPHLLRPRWRQ